MKDLNKLFVSEELANDIKDVIPSEDELLELSLIFKIFSDVTRLKILHALLESKLCVSDIALILGMSHSSISHQLKNLRDSNLVRTTKEGKIVFYEIFDDHVSEIILVAYEHIMEG